jgi:membrane protein DedA with SNARE-associated domain
VLALLGYLAHLAGDISVVEKYSSEISHVIIGLVILIALFFIVRYFIKKNRKK